MNTMSDLFIDKGRYPVSAAALLQHRAHYRQHHFVKLPGFLQGLGFLWLGGEVKRLRDFAFRRDFEMACMGSSPRHMSTLSGDGIAALSTVIPQLYQDPELLRFLCFVTGEDVLPIPDLDRFVLNDLHQVSDTFGAHYDDYPISLALIFEAPPAAGGGGVELVARSASLDALRGPDVTRVFLAAGDAYLLKSDTTAHRVAPLNVPGARRTGLNFAYTTRDYVPIAVTPSA